MKRVLVPIDFSEVTDVLLDALNTFDIGPKKVYLLHAIEHDIGSLTGFGVDPHPGSDEDVEQKGLFERRVKELTDKGLDVVPLFRQGAPLDVILEAAEEHDVDLIMVGSHGHGALYDLVAGTVSQGVIHKAHRPVLLIPSPRPEPAEKEPEVTPY